TIWSHTSKQIRLAGTIGESPLDLDEVVGLHGEHDVGGQELGPPESPREMTGQVDPEAASGLTGPRIGRTATPEPQPGRAHLDLRPVPDPLAQGGFRERTPNDVSVTDEVDRPGASDPRRQRVRPPRDGLHPAQDPDPVNPSLQPRDAGFGRRRCHRRIGDGGVDTAVDRVEEMPGLLPPAVSPVLREPRRALAAAILPVAGLEAS